MKHRIKMALLSVSDKSGIVEFSKELHQLGIELISTGGTAKAISEAGIPVKEISELTGFSEIMEDRVKTLHPLVHGGLLGKLDSVLHLGQMQELGIKSIDLLVVNLYPFEQTLKKNAPHEEIVENIDIGGPAMLRSAAKNYLWTAPVVNPAKYDEIVSLLKANDCALDEDYRLGLAADVYAHTANYDSIIADYFNKITHRNIPEILTISGKKEQSLRYGENPHQNAALYGNFLDIFEQLHGKELSYNNIVDMDAAAKIILEFDETALAIIKHTNPCGVATGSTIKEAWEKAFATDTASPYGGIIITNKVINLEAATAMHDLFTELIIASDFDVEALALLEKKKARRLLKVDFKKLANSISNDIKSVAGGFLFQNSDTELMSYTGLKTVTKRIPTPEEMKALLFGWRIAKHVKSNAIVYTAADRTLAIGAGQMSRVDSSRIAVEKAGLMNIDLHGSAMASDAYFPFADGVEEAAKSGATCVIQPGGSIRDEEVIKAADENNMAMVFTGMRHFRH